MCSTSHEKNLNNTAAGGPGHGTSLKSRNTDFKPAAYAVGLKHRAKDEFWILNEYIHFFLIPHIIVMGLRRECKIIFSLAIYFLKSIITSKIIIWKSSYTLKNNKTLCISG